MKTRGRCGNGSPPPGEHRLVAIAILRAIRPFDVRRKRYVSDGVHCTVDRSSVARPETDYAASMKAPLDDLAVDDQTLSKLNARPRPQLLARMHERLPVLSARSR